MTAHELAEVIPISASPPLKWAGGKTKLIQEIRARFPRDWGRYFEPFAGGAALFFRLWNDFPTSIDTAAPPVLNDANGSLMEFYRTLANCPTYLIGEVQSLAERHNVRRYGEVRAAWNQARETWSPIRRAATFLYLNKTCFNGLWRVNSRGDFNVPPDPARAKTAICRPDVLLAASAVLAKSDLRCGDFATACIDADAGDLVYMDSPYAPISKTASFTSYNADGFGPIEQNRLEMFCRELVRRGVHVIISNSDTPEMRGLWSDANIWNVERVTAARAINSDAAKRGHVGELLITAAKR